MSRKKPVLDGITKSMRGIEIAPWFAPLTPKSQGYNCLVLDVFDYPTLLQRARDCKAIAKESISAIEAVDIVGTATEIATLVPKELHGAYDYIVSSHNFEHLPNPIKFLQGCQKVLKEDGILSMAVPDARACFDFFRPHTMIAQWLRAFRDDQAKPDAEQIFQHQAYDSVLDQNGRNAHAFSLDSDATKVKLIGDLGTAYENWLNARDGDAYSDAHCTVMTPASFELLITECRYLGLTSFECVSISDPIGCEFHVRLVNRRESQTPDDINAIRTRLAHQIWEERTQASAKNLSSKILGPLKRYLRRSQG